MKKKLKPKKKYIQNCERGVKILSNLRNIQRQQLEKTNWVKHWSGTQRKQHEDLIQNKHILFCTIKYSYSGNEMKWFPSILLFAFSITGNERKKKLKKKQTRTIFPPKSPNTKVFTNYLKFTWKIQQCNEKTVQRLTIAKYINYICLHLEISERVAYWHSIRWRRCNRYALIYVWSTQIHAICKYFG